MSGYIYIRSNEYWELYNAYKLGKTQSIIDREQIYVTGEIKRGLFIMIIEIDLTILNDVDYVSMKLNIKFCQKMKIY